jgi:hypothetical protein
MKPLREEEKTRRIGHGSVIADYVFDRMQSGVELLDGGAKRIHPKASDEGAQGSIIRLCYPS